MRCILRYFLQHIIYWCYICIFFFSATFYLSNLLFQLLKQFNVSCANVPYADALFFVQKQVYKNSFINYRAILCYYCFHLRKLEKTLKLMLLIFWSNHGSFNLSNAYKTYVSERHNQGCGSELLQIQFNILKRRLLLRAVLGCINLQIRVN